MAMQQTPMYMKDWIASLDAVISMNGKELLNHAGKISLNKNTKSFRYNSQKLKSCRLYYI